MPRVPVYNGAYHDPWAWSLAVRGATDKEIAQAFGVSVTTINNWKYTGNVDANGNKELSSFGKVLQTSKEAADAVVEQSLFRRATGFKTTDIKKQVDTDRKTGKPTVVKTEIVEKEYPPDTMAIMYWLNNRSRKTGEWSQKQEIALTGGDSGIEAAVREMSVDEARNLLKRLKGAEDHG